MKEEKSKQSKKERYMQWIVNNPKKTIVAFFCLILLAFPFLSKITQDFSYRAWFDENDRLLMEYDAFEQKFANDDNIVIAVHSPSGIFDKETIAIVDGITEKSWSLPETLRVDSITNYNWVHTENNEIVIEPLVSTKDELSKQMLEGRKQVALNDEILPGYMISPDAKTTVIYIYLKPLIIDYSAFVEGINYADWYNERKGIYKKEISALESLSDEKKNVLLSSLLSHRDAYYKALYEKIIKKEDEKGGPVNAGDVEAIIESSPYLEIGKIAPDVKKDQKNRDALLQLTQNDLQSFKGYLTRSLKNSSVQNEKASIAIKKIIAEYRNKKGDQSIYYTGDVPMNDFFREASYNDVNTIFPLVLLLIIILLYVTIRRVAGVLLPLIVVVLSIILGMASLGFLNFVTKNITLNAATMVVPIFLLAIGIADAVHILVGVNYYLKLGKSKKDAVLLSLNKNFGPTFLTSVSTAIGFLSFSLSEVLPVGAMGIIAAIGSMCAWGVTYFILGPLLVIFPYRIKKTAIEVKDETEEGALARWSISWSDFLEKHKVALSYAFIGIAVIAMVLTFNNKISSDPYSYFRKNVEVRKGLDFIEDNVGAPHTVQIGFNTGKKEGVKDPEFLKKVLQYESWLKEQKGEDGRPLVVKTFSILDVLREMNCALNKDNKAYYKIPDERKLIAQELLLYSMGVPDKLDLSNVLSADEDAMRMVVLWRVKDSYVAVDQIARLREQAKEMGLDVNVTGKMPLWHSLNPKVVDSFYESIFLAVVFISILLFIVFRSFTLGIYALIANLMPLFFGGAILKLLGRPLDMGTVVVFSVGLGIAVDDTIHFLFNFKKTTESGMKTKYAITHIFSSVGSALISTTVILVGSFSMYMLGAFLPNANFGMMLATILVFALLTDMVFLPAFLMYIKKSNNDDENKNDNDTQKKATIGAGV